VVCRGWKAAGKWLENGWLFFNVCLIVKVGIPVRIQGDWLVIAAVSNVVLGQAASG
jgi:hypothetical protein